jgi:DNA-binding YbaB/EbfC family protein
MKDLSQIMRQAQQMQAKMEEARKRLEAMEVEGSAGGGLVTVRLSGKTEMLGVKIAPALMGDEAEILEDLIKAAHDDARRKLEDAQNAEYKSLSGGMGGMLPGFKLPF